MGEFTECVGARGICVSGSYAFVADYDNGLKVIDISDQANPFEVNQFDDGGYAYRIDISGSYAYVADYDDGLEVLNISDFIGDSSISIFGYNLILLLSAMAGISVILMFKNRKI